MVCTVKPTAADDRTQESPCNLGWCGSGDLSAWRSQAIALYERMQDLHDLVWVGDTLQEKAEHAQSYGGYPTGFANSFANLSDAIDETESVIWFHEEAVNTLVGAMGPALCAEETFREQIEGAGKADELPPKPPPVETDEDEPEDEESPSLLNPLNWPPWGWIAAGVVGVGLFLKLRF